jgi:hypothetical protein
MLIWQSLARQWTLIARRLVFHQPPPRFGLQPRRHCNTIGVIHDSTFLYFTDTAATAEPP